MNFLLLTEHYPTNSLGYAKVSQQIDAEKCDKSTTTTREISLHVA
jgi:hypothetical protein